MNDAQIKELFRSQKEEVADDDFARRVMAHLPRRSSIVPLIVIAISCFAGIAAVVAIVGITPVVEFWKEIMSLSVDKITVSMIGIYLYIVAAITMIGLSIKAVVN